MAEFLSKASQRLAHLRLAFRSTRAADPRLLPMMVVIPLVVLGLFVALGLLVGAPVLLSLAGVGMALATALLVFGRRAQLVALGSMVGRSGAAAAVLQSMRGNWHVTPAVAVTRRQDFVHRVVGRPGVILVGEGSPARVTSLLKQERRRVARVAGDVPVHEVSVGQGDGQVPLQKLQNQLNRYPRKLKRGQLGELNVRLDALGHADIPIPKGPLPRSTNIRGAARRR